VTTELLELSPDEEEALKILNERYEPVSDIAVLCDGQALTGFICHGPGGTGVGRLSKPSIKPKSPTMS
jgi:hypothetical protein